MSDLAIVIPAYKGAFFKRTLSSIARQTCRNFSVYIGDDASDFDFEGLTMEFQHTIEIKYKRFNVNVGGENLVAQWERCVDLTNGEEWIWLFSDDDIMDDRCVESFYAARKRFPDFDVFHFNVVKIDEQEGCIGASSAFPPIMTSEEFLKRRLSGELNSTVVEYIFRKEHFLNNDRFQPFDLAWGSDDATWIKLAKPNGIKTIIDGTVFWRRSQFNISPNYQDWPILKRKFQAELDFIKWVLDQIDAGVLEMDKTSTVKLLNQWFRLGLDARINAVSSKRLAGLLTMLYVTLEGVKCPPHVAVGAFLFKTYSFAKLLAKRSIGFISLPSSSDSNKS